MKDSFLFYLTILIFPTNHQIPFGTTFPELPWLREFFQNIFIFSGNLYKDREEEMKCFGNVMDIQDVIAVCGFGFWWYLSCAYWP